MPGRNYWRHMQRFMSTTSVSSAESKKEKKEKKEERSYGGYVFGGYVFYILMNSRSYRFNVKSSKFIRTHTYVTLEPQGSHVDRVLLLQEETGEQGERSIVGGVRRCESRCT